MFKVDKLLPSENDAIKRGLLSTFEKKLSTIIKITTAKVTENIKKTSHNELTDAAIPIVIEAK
jgi:hypothetical protein